MNKIYLLICFVFLTGCTITHINKSDGGFDASNYSVGMDRKALRVDIKSPDGINTVISIGESNSSNSIGKMQRGMEVMLEGLKELRP